MRRRVRVDRQPTVGAREACEAFIKRGVRFLQLKLILLLGSVPDGDKEPQDLLSKFALIERFTPIRPAVEGRFAVKKQGSGWRIAESSPLPNSHLVVSAVAMVAALPCYSGLSSAGSSGCRLAAPRPGVLNRPERHRGDFD